VGSLYPFTGGHAAFGWGDAPMRDLYLLIIGSFVTVIWVLAVVLFIWEEKTEKKSRE
jgi:hypothetical protein